MISNLRSKIGLLRNFKLSKKARSVSAFVIGALMIGVCLISTSDVKLAKGETLNTPRFNFLPGDYEMLRVGKTTDPTWGDPINANIGDRVAYIFYYHNGIVDSTATHVRARVDLPIEQSTILKSTSYLWSDQTSAISDTVVDGSVVGQSGATINLPSNGRIQYVPGSTKWFPNGSATGAQMPDGITSQSGLDLGSIQGCWQYAGFVTFLVDIKGPAQLVMDKTVARPGDTNWQKAITVNPTDSVAYHLGIRNDGGTTATSVSVKDILPQYMTYETGTTYIYTKDHPEGIKQNDALFTTGINLPNMVPGSDGTIYVTYRARVNGNIPAGSFVLNNVAKLFMQGVEQDQDQAKVYVTASRGLVIDKEVSNGISWVEQNQVHLGDEILYRIVVKNTGNIAINNTKVKDAIPVYLRYKVGSTTLDGSAVGDELVSAGGMLIGNLAPGQQKTIMFTGTVIGCPPIGGYTLTNTAYTWADMINEISDTAVSVLSINSPLEPNININ